MLNECLEGKHLLYSTQHTNALLLIISDQAIYNVQGETF
jgi:hypothetical protein